MQAVTLVFAFRTVGSQRQVLLAMKKRGFGAGRWNGPGGKVEPGETIKAAAIRECQEEVGIVPRQLVMAGRLTFGIEGDSDHNHDMHIFTCAAWVGEPAESDEMRPEWFAFGDIPYDRMWPADRLWLPHLLAGKPFGGSILIGDDDRILRADVHA